MLTGTEGSTRRHNLVSRVAKTTLTRRGDFFQEALFHAVACATLFVVAGCGASLELTSEWTGREMAIDGSTADWNDMQAKIAGPDVRIGVKNDNDHVYICMTTPARSTQFQMLALGTTVWFDGEGQKSKTLGIHFPVAGLTRGRRSAPPTNADDLQLFMQNLINNAQRQMEITGPGTGENKKFADRQAKGVNAHLGYADGTLTYELEMPIRRTAEEPYGVTLDPAKPLMIYFETGDYASLMRSQAGAPEAAPSGGGGGGRGGRGGGGGGGGASMPGRDVPEGLKHWLTVHLAAGSSDASK